MGSKREILRRMFSDGGFQSRKRIAAESEIREKLSKDIIQTTAGRSDSWLEARRVQLNEAWKKTNKETRSMFCAKEKHERCTFDSDCSCECHPKPVVV